MNEQHLFGGGLALDMKAGRAFGSIFICEKELRPKRSHPQDPVLHQKSTLKENQSRKKGSRLFCLLLYKFSHVDLCVASCVCT